MKNVPKGGGYSPEMQAKIDEMKKELKKYTDDKATVDKNLETFDTLDYAEPLSQPEFSE